MKKNKDWKEIGENMKKRLNEQRLKAQSEAIVNKYGGSFSDFFAKATLQEKKTVFLCVAYEATIDQIASITPSRIVRQSQKPAPQSKKIASSKELPSQKHRHR